MKICLVSVSIFMLMMSCSSESAEEYCQKGNKLSENYNWEEAITMYDKALEKDPTYVSALVYRGFAKAMGLEQLQEGIADLESVLDLHSNDVGTLYITGFIYGDHQKHQKALPYLRKALKAKKAALANSSKKESNTTLTIDINEIHYELGLQYVRVEDFEKAIVHLKTCIAEKSHLRDSYFLRGEAYAGLQNFDAACNDFTESVRLGDVMASEMQLKYCRD
ncbi:MAG: tetratricopeptide repeat protein [Bacteroidota bacterium]